MHIGARKLLVIGDRVLVTPEAGEERTQVGLYLPPTAVEKNAVQSGRIVEVGPGAPIPFPAEGDDEPWRTNESRGRYVPMEAHVGDLAIFLRHAATEIHYEGTKYLVVPQGAVLILVREEDTAPGDFPDAL